MNDTMKNFRKQKQNQNNQEEMRNTAKFGIKFNGNQFAVKENWDQELDFEVNIDQLEHIWETLGLSEEDRVIIIIWAYSFILHRLVPT